jgi:hypothetical protein
MKIDPELYRHQQIDWVTGHIGGSLIEVIAITMAPLVGTGDSISF